MRVFAKQQTTPLPDASFEATRRGAVAQPAVSFGTMDATRQPRPAIEQDDEGAGSGPARTGHRFSRIPIHPTSPVRIQTKLAVSAAGDRYEREADRISEQVVRTGAPPRQRTCACGGTCTWCRAEQHGLPTQRLQAGHAGSLEAPPLVQEVLASPGQPLDAATREFMEPRFGHDFSKLRVHADPRAAESAHAVGARAYTGGTHVVFGRNQYSPGSPDGRRLLAHELTHVLQQTGASGGEAAPSADGAAIQREPQPDAPPVRQKIKKIILDKQQGLQIHELEAGPPETVPVLEHCSPKVGRYTAHVKPNATRSEQLDWVTDQNVGCAKPLGYITKTQEARKVGTLEGVTTLEFEVRDEPPGTATGETTTAGGAGGAGESEGAGAAETPARVRGVRQIWSEIQALPPHIQEFLINPKGGITAAAEDYEHLLRIGLKLQAAGVAADELYRHRRDSGPFGSYAAFEAEIDRMLAARAAQQAARAQNVLSRERVRTQLFGRDALYKRYQALLKALGKPQLAAAVAGTTVQVTGISPDLIKERDDLHADLIQAGFPGGLSDFVRFIRDFEATFERETLSLAFDVLRKYDYLLMREYAHFAGGKTEPTSKAAKLLASLGKVREPAQALYDLAETERDQAGRAGARHRGVKGESWEGDPKKAAALRSSAAAHEAQADELVATGAPDLPVIAWQDFPREKLVGRSTIEEVRYDVAWYLATHQAAVRRAEALLAGKPEHLYELDNLLAFSYVAQDIQPGTIYDLIIQNRRQQIQSDKSIREILIGILAVALAIVSFGGGTVGLLAAGAAFGIGAAQAVTALEEYDAKSTLYMAQLLKDEPSAAWAIFAVVGAGLDAAAVVQALKVVVPAAKAFNSTGDLAALSKGLAGLDEQVTAKIMKAAEQARVAEQELKTAVGDLKTMFTSPGRKLRSVGLPGGELLGNLVAISYYYLKSRALQSFERFVVQLEKEGLIVWSKLAAEDQQALRQAFDQALSLSNARQLPYGRAIYDRLSPRARTAFPADATDRFAAQGKALGKTDQEIIDTLESEARRERLVEGTGEQKLANPTEAGDVRTRPNVRLTEYDPTVGNSGRLAENLTAAGRPNPRVNFPEGYYEAHHIIPSNEGPKQLRTLLEDLKLDINGEFNGVWLPRGAETLNPTGAMRHEFLTGNREYFARLRTILTREPPLTREQVIEKLRAIAEYLNRGEFPPPKL